MKQYVHCDNMEETRSRALAVFNSIFKHYAF